ncbi:MAG TPA: hypothetical protein VE912_23265 [Bacteroidales bacterium]|nr:hypothetical protein [Bacteroidales bacterium]
MKKSIFIISTLLLLVLLTIFPVKKNRAIPAFARKYRISCQTCHSPAIPKLKPYGDQFALDGFRIADQPTPRYFIKTGDDKLSLLRDLPLAVRFDGHMSYNFGDEARQDFGAPFGIKLLSGGELSDKLSYYFYFFINEKGEVAGVEDAFVMYNSLFNSGLDFYLGQFQVSDPLYKRELRLTFEDYNIYTVAPGTSTIDLKYDRGIMLDYSLPTGTGITVEIINGNGIGEADAKLLFDRDKYKNVLAKISQSIGDNIELGVFGYLGKESIPEANTEAVNTVNMIGPNLTFNLLEKLEFNFQYVYRTDSEILIPATTVLRDEIETQGGFGEIVFSPNGDRSKWYMVGLVNYIDSDLDYLDYKSTTIHAGYLYRRNVRLVGEYTWDFSAENNQFGRASVGIITAF